MHTSLGLFWDTSFLFNLVVMIAAFLSVAEENSACIGHFSRLSSIVTWSVVALTWPLYRRGCHHRQSCAWGLAIASALCMTLVWRWRNIHYQGVFEMMCYDRMDGDTDLRTVSRIIWLVVELLAFSLTGLFLAYEHLSWK